MPYYEQPGASRAVNRDGKTILTVTYAGDEEAPDPFLGPVLSRTVTKDVAGVIRTTYQIEIDDPDSPTRPTSGATFEFIAATREVPIEAHSNFAEPFLLPKDIKFIKDKLNSIVSQNAMPDLSSTTTPARAASLFGYLARGIISYYEPSILVRKTYQASSPPSAARIGKVASPGVRVPGSAPGATFLLTSVNSRGQAGLYSVTEEYLMSGPTGWDTFLYT